MEKINILSGTLLLKALMKVTQVAKVEYILI